jgi:predicted amidohydrolase
MSEKLKIGLIQISSTLDFKENLQKIKNYIQEAVDQGARAIFLPECFYSLSNGTEKSPYLVHESNEHYENIRSLATDFGVYLIGGSVSYIGETGTLNRVYNFDPQGKVLGIYDKVHLFACDITKNGKRKKVDEADIFVAGNKPCIVEVEGFKIGIGVCFDLRFSNFLENYFRKVDIMTFASAFTVPTGKAHWHVLNRARAIEGQAYVVSAAQSGQNHPNVRTYGHSLVVNPWGEILADLEESEGCAVIEISRQEVVETRQKIIMS